MQYYNYPFYIVFHQAVRTEVYPLVERCQFSLAATSSLNITAQIPLGFNSIWGYVIQESQLDFTSCF